MRLFQLILFLFLTSAATTGRTQNDADHILWRAKELEWKDFKGKPKNNSEYDALTHSQIHAPNSWNQDSLHIEVATNFVRSKSWATKSRTRDLLKHEQLHFDITEYHTRLFRKAILSYRFSTYQEVGSEVSTFFSKFHKKATAMQSQYDRDSDHSKNTKGQEKWNKKVATLLEKTKAYTQTKIDLYIGYIR